ncbi:MAG: DUF4097 family beta strand repeat-containing protein [Balneolaceae bacterium]
MKKFSWEIIVAGLLFIFVALYLIGKPSKEEAESTAAVAVVPTPEDAAEPTPVRTIDLKNLEELAALKELENVELNEEELLKSLKGMAHLLPSEVREEFQEEIEKALSEITDEDISINLDLDGSQIVLNRNMHMEQGKWSSTSPGVYSYLNEFDASSVEDVVLKLPYGSITVVGSTDNKSSLVLHASGQVSSTQDLEAHLSPDFKVTDSEAVFKIEPRGSTHEHNIQLQAILSIPENIELVVETSTGHIETSNIQGEQVYKTGGGHMKLNNIQGDVTAISEGGHITIKDCSGEFLVRSGGGHLKASNCTGEMLLKTSGGNIEALNVDGELAASTQGGNIIISMKNFTDDLTAETSAGNIQIALPSSTNADIELKASSLVEVSGITFDGTKQKTNLKGTLNSGGSDIIAFSKYGQVTVKSND